jgi:hypothetical protein
MTAFTATVATIEDDAPEFRASAHADARLARRIRDDAEAIAVAEEIAAKLAEGAAARDRERILPYEEMELDLGRRPARDHRAEGLRRRGRASGNGRARDRALSRADGSIGQIPQNHFFMLEALRLQGTEEQKRFFYAPCARGRAARQRAFGDRHQDRARPRHPAHARRRSSTA